MDSQPYLYLTTAGHKSGRPHEIEIWYVRHGQAYYIVSEKREAAHWVQNIRANPSVSFRIGAAAFAGRASIPDDAALIQAVKSKMEAKYNWSDGLVVQPVLWTLAFAAGERGASSGSRSGIILVAARISRPIRSAI